MHIYNDLFTFTPVSVPLSEVLTWAFMALCVGYGIWAGID